MEQGKANKLLKHLTLISEELAKGKYKKAKGLFELTKEGRYALSDTSK